MSFSFESSGPNVRPDRVKPVPAGPSPISHSRKSSISSTNSFASAVETHTKDADHPDRAETIRFSAEEEEQMVKQSNELKVAANRQFAVKDYSTAIGTYDKALVELPSYLDYELALLQSNIAACHIQLNEWKEAIDSAERGLEGLERELPTPKPKNDKRKDSEGVEQNGKPDKEEIDDNKIIELPDDEDEDTINEKLRQLNISDQRKSDILRIRTKLLLRRARAKVMLYEQQANPASKPASFLDPDNTEPPTQPKKSGIMENGSQWANLSVALSDYQLLSTPEYFHNLPSSDQKTVIEMLRSLPPKVEAAKKKDVDEMMGKLKELGNGILKPFGLSTDMFKMTQDPNTGGWSMGFDGKTGK